MNKSIHLFEIPMHAWTMEKTIMEIDQCIEKKIPIQHVVVNVAKLVNMQNDKELRESVNSCDITNIDGKGIIFGAKFLGIDIPERVAGIDLMFRLLELAEQKNYRPFLLGAQHDILKKAVSNIQQKYPKLEIAGWHHGYFWDDETLVISQIVASKADMLFVAITSPKKENFINRWKDRLDVPFIMGVGGSFDIVAGKTKRAPKWMQDLGLEWFYRLLQEPRRMWKRYLITNSKFAWMLINEKYFKTRKVK